MKHSTRGAIVRAAILTPISIAASVALAGALGGCSVVHDIVSRTHQKSFATVADAQGEWNGDAPWLPDDGTAVRLVQSDSGTTSVLRVTSEAPLDGCVATERRSGPNLGADWVGDDWVPVTEGEVCGDWMVVPVAGGYLGWTPIDPHEAQAASATDD